MKHMAGHFDFVVFLKGIRPGPVLMVLTRAVQPIQNP
jgi:hypothetical protein